jgi:hypothetical protein
MTIEHQSFVDFLRQYNMPAHRPVDLLLMDVEGAEYGIIEAIASTFYADLKILQETILKITENIEIQKYV